MEVAALVASYLTCLFQQNCLGQCKCLEIPRGNFKTLKKQMKKLNARATDVRKRLDHRKTMLTRREPDFEVEPNSEVMLWLEDVLNIQSIIVGIEQRRSLNSCFPNCYDRLRTGKLIDEKTKEVIELFERGSFSDDSLVHLQRVLGNALPTTTIVGNSTARNNLNQIMEFLKNDEIGSIGVFGMGGVGKTTIMTEIHNLLLKEKECFDSVIWVTASRDSNLEKLQKDVGKVLGLTFSEDDGQISRAIKLLDALTQRGRFVLIIDDLWQAFFLNHIGIPTPTRENGCKLVITTRSLRVCRGMETDKEIGVCLLSPDEAWDLFKAKVGEDVLFSTEIQPVAREVARECGGLPLAIIIVGIALRGENNLVEWQNALAQLRESTASTSIEGLEDQVFSRLRFSYERLRDDVTRSCFLFCALYPEDHLIETEELIKYWMWEGLLGDAGTIKAKMSKGKVIVNELKKACMLESVGQEGSNHEYVRLHDLIRDMAIALTRERPRCIIRAGLVMTIPPEENEWVSELARVSLMRNDLKFLPDEPICPKLCTLLLQYNSISKGIKPTFFDNMRNLKVLDLSYTGIPHLPASLSNLENLQALLLRSCWNLISVPNLANLKQLRALDLSLTRMCRLPEGMEMLVNLRHLDLSVTCTNEFPTGLLPIYKHLENLLMLRRPQESFTSSMQHSPQESSTSGYNRVTYVEELINSTRLVTLEANFNNSQELDMYVRSGHSAQLETFNLCVGSPSHLGRMDRNSVSFFGVDFLVAERQVILPDQTRELIINNCPDVTLLSICLSTPVHLNICRIKYCNQMEWILADEGSNLHSLERLELHYLVKLRGICRGIAPPDALARLKVLQVSACNGLKSLFPLELIRNLRNLKEVEVEYCMQVQTLATDEVNDEIVEANSSLIILPSLQKLRMKSLPSLVSILTGVMLCESLHTIEVVDCPLLNSLPLSTELGQPPPSALKQIKGSERWWHSLNWNHPSSSIVLSPFFIEVAERREESGADSE